MSDAQTYIVPDMSCAHCVAAVTEEVERVAGVESVAIDLETKQVVVQGDGVSGDEVREAIHEAGFEPA